MLKEQWNKEHASDKEAERQKFVLNKERNLELIQHNAAEKVLRDAQVGLDKARDRELLEAALAKEKALADIEEAEKIKRRQQVIELQKYYKKAAADAGAWEREVDAFVQAEAERQFKMREAQWIRED